MLFGELNSYDICNRFTQDYLRFLTPLGHKYSHVRQINLDFPRYSVMNTSFDILISKISLLPFQHCFFGNVCIYPSIQICSLFLFCVVDDMLYIV